MGTITIQVSEEIIDPVLLGSGRIGAVVLTEETCSSRWTVTVKTATSAWIQWSSMGGGSPIVSKIGGTTVNGELLTSATRYSVEISGFVSPIGNINDYLSQVNFILKSAEGGSVLDTQTVSRFHSNNFC